MRIPWPVLLLAPLSAQAVPIPTPDTLARWRDAILPSPAELEWTALAWRPTLAEGLLEGAASDRPVLVWAMNGHPLGLT